MRILNLDFDVGEDAHEELEGARNGVLRAVLHAEEAQDDGGDDAVEGADDERHEVGEGACAEGGVGYAEKGEHVEGLGCGEAGEPGVGEDGKDGHFC